jgi:hypothetical protein
VFLASTRCIYASMHARLLVSSNNLKLNIIVATILIRGNYVFLTFYKRSIRFSSFCRMFLRALLNIDTVGQHSFSEDKLNLPPYIVIPSYLVI